LMLGPVIRTPLLDRMSIQLQFTVGNTALCQYFKWTIEFTITIITRTYIYSETCLILHAKGPGKCVGLYRMSEYSGFILVNRNTLGP
jgi:hypothetical protein